MINSRKTKEMIAFLCLGVFAGFAVWILVPNTNRRFVGINLTPATHDMANQFVLEGQVVKFESKLETGDSPVVLHFRRPCGCISLLDGQSEPIGNSLAVQANQTLSITVQVDTNGQIGRLNYTIPIVAIDEAENIVGEVSLQLKANVQTGLVACPSSVHLTQQQPEGCVFLCDSLLAKDEQVLDVKNADSFIAVEWTEASGDMSFGGWSLEKRYCVSVRAISFPSRASIESQEVAIYIGRASGTDDLNCRVLSIPVFIEGEVVRISPRALDLVADGGGQIESDISVFCSNPQMEVSVLACPEFCRLSKFKSEAGFEYFSLIASEGTGEIEFLIGENRMIVPGCDLRNAPLKVGDWYL